jgi:hypothetical protein
MARRLSGPAPASRSDIRSFLGVNQKPDGHIVRVPDVDRVMIDLGIGDRLEPGTTFDVYDQRSGTPVPRRAMGVTELPPGKCSIEVTRVMPGYSECRIVRRTPGVGIGGVGIGIGDLVVRCPPEPLNSD